MGQGLEWEPCLSCRKGCPCTRTQTQLDTPLPRKHPRQFLGLTTTASADWTVDSTPLHAANGRLASSR